MRNPKALAIAVTFVTAAACGSGGGGGDDAPPTLVIKPFDAVLTVGPGAPATQAYTATLVGSDGSVLEDVTADTSFTVDLQGLGDFAGPTFTATGVRGGRAIVTGSHGDTTTQANLTVRFQQVIVTPGTPADAPDHFGGAADPNLAPTWAYPENGVLVPPNLTLLDYQWNAAGGADLFELHFQNDLTDILVYTSTPSYQADLAGWGGLAYTNRGADVPIQLRATIYAGGGVGTAAPMQIGFAEQDVAGGIYYWAASSQAIIRFDFGNPTQLPEEFYTAAMAGGRCVSCHVVSRDGTKMALNLYVEADPYGSGILDIASRTLIADNNYKAVFQTYSPDGGRMVTSWNGVLSLRDGSTAADLGPVPTGGFATQPDWSVDGSRLTYVTAPGGNDRAFTSGAIVTQSWDGTAFGPVETIVPAGVENNFKPTFAPDGSWIVFNKSTGDSDVDPDARLVAVRVSDHQVVELDRASGPTGSMDSWARWSPFVQTWRGGTLMWFTFSSSRAYGNRLPAGRPQIWMTAFDPANPTDPAFPPLWVPFQDMATGNHIAQWTTRIIE
jgi:hypothetical protein